MKLDSVFDLPYSSIPSRDCECNLCEPDMNFKCKGCLLENLPYCLGQGDEYYEYCTPVGIN